MCLEGNRRKSVISGRGEISLKLSSTPLKFGKRDSFLSYVMNQWNYAVHFLSYALNQAIYALAFLPQIRLTLTSDFYEHSFPYPFNPLLPSAAYIRRSAKIFILIKEGSSKKFIWASRLWVGRRKEPILSFIMKNYEKVVKG